MISPATCTCGGTPVADIHPDESPVKFEITAPPDATPPGNVIKCTSAVTIRLDVVLTCPGCRATATIPSGDTITALTKIYRDDAANTIARRVRAAVDLANNVWGRREGDPPLRNVTIGAPARSQPDLLENLARSVTRAREEYRETIAERLTDVDDNG